MSRATSENRWDVELYNSFAAQRRRPAYDLLDRLAVSAPRALADLGCGSGEMTLEMARRWPESRVVGLDSSPQMIDQARQRHGDQGIDWLQSDVATWESDPELDLLFCNAVLHWVPDHRRLLLRWLRGMAAGGAVAFQVPNNYGAPSHRLIATALENLGELAAWAEAAWVETPVGSLDAYARLLSPEARWIDAWETTYLHTLQGEDAVLRWTSGTALRPLRDGMAEPLWRRFEAEYARLLRQAYPRQADGRTFFAFRRLFLIAYR